MAEQSAISLDEFKARLPLVEVVARHVRLTRRGREHWGCARSISEKTPSFTVSEAKGFYHCFGCGQHGNAIDFMMAVEGLDFAQAIARLAELTGLPAPQRGRHAGAAGRSDALCGQRGGGALVRRAAGERAGGRGGGLSRRARARPRDHPALRARLRAGRAHRASSARCRPRATPRRRAIEAGLLVRPDDGGPSFDRFRHRVTFPIHDRRGRVVGFGGRALGRGPREVPEYAGDAAVPQGRAALRPRSGPAGGAPAAARWSWPRATWT